VPHWKTPKTCGEHFQPVACCRVELHVCLVCSPPRLQPPSRVVPTGHEVPEARVRKHSAVSPTGHQVSCCLLSSLEPVMHRLFIFVKKQYLSHSRLPPDALPEPHSGMPALVAGEWSPGQAVVVGTSMGKLHVLCGSFVIFFLC